MIFSQGVKTFFESPKNVYYISSDLHIHTVFSDGVVWPTLRVDEAVRDSIDLISLTEHIEYQSHLSDIPHKNRNRSFQIAGGYVNNKPLAVVHGTEITKPMPPGHFNAIFINDANTVPANTPKTTNRPNVLTTLKSTNLFLLCVITDTVEVKIVIVKATINP